MNGIICENERAESSAIIDRHSAVDVTNGATSAGWQHASDRLSAYPTGERGNLIKSHAAKSAEGGAQSPRTRRAPRESRRVSLAQASGYVQLNQYRLLEPIGQGSYGIVKLAYNEEDDTHYAMKILSKRKLMRRAGLFGRAPPRRPGPGPAPDPLQRIYREIAILKKLDHPNVVKLVEVLDDPAEDQLYLVFQLLEGGPVIEIPTDSPLSEDTARQYFRDVLLGVEYLHYQRIAHRDIKPANLLLGEGRVQVADLGASGELAGRLSGAVGTPAFRAPEAAAPADNYVGEAADIWSLGVTLYAMVTGRVPWTGSTAAELHKKVLSEPLTFPPRYQPSRPLRHLLTRMLDKDPAKRATMKEIKEHEWTTRNGEQPLPSEEENCRLVEVTDEDMARVVTSIPNLSTLILIKTMLKKHSFQNPFLRSRENSARRESLAPRAGEAAAARRGGLARAGRSLSAPGDYLTERQASFDIALESVQESRDQSQDVTSPKEQTTSTIPETTVPATNPSTFTTTTVSTTIIPIATTVSRTLSANTVTSTTLPVTVSEIKLPAGPTIASTNAITSTASNTSTISTTILATVAETTVSSTAVSKSTVSSTAVSKSTMSSTAVFETTVSSTIFSKTSVPAPNIASTVSSALIKLPNKTRQIEQESKQVTSGR